MPRIVTRRVIDSIASVTRPSWRKVVALRLWRRHAKTVIMSGMSGGSLCRILGWGIHSLHVAQPPCLISVLAKVLDIANYFIDRHTSGFVEGFNNKLKVIKRRCYGIVNVTHLFQRIQLDLYGYSLFAMKIIEL